MAVRPITFDEVRRDFHASIAIGRLLDEAARKRGLEVDRSAEEHAIVRHDGRQITFWSKADEFGFHTHNPSIGKRHGSPSFIAQSKRPLDKRVARSSDGFHLTIRPKGERPFQIGPINSAKFFDAIFDRALSTGRRKAGREFADKQREALSWFDSRRGQRTGWPDQLPSGLFLANKAKGIHKPKDWEHALSIRVMLSSDYEDGDIEFDGGGRWHFRYHQEGEASEGPEAEFTNRALLRNRDDGVPIGVMRQVAIGPPVQYEVLGLGRVIGYADGFFHIVGPVAIDDPLPVPDVIEHFDPNNIEDARRFALAVIHRRQGQQRFRQKLLRAYDGRCAISGCDVEPLLDAAHIVPYRGPDTNTVQNGLLLRTDLHTLFDLNLLTIDPKTLVVNVSRSITQPEYASLSGVTMRSPRDIAQRPSMDALQWRLASYRVNGSE